MRCTMLASGSKGNCIYLEGEESAILIDCGLSAKEILTRITEAGGCPERILGIFVTHEHTDHIRGLDVLARRLGVPVFGTEGTLAEAAGCRKHSKKPVDIRKMRCHEPVRVDGFLVEAFATSHDAREPCGFRVDEAGVSLGCCTDTGTVTSGMERMMKGCDALILESNHCPEMLRTGPYPEYLKRRIRSKVGHLSNEDACRFLHGMDSDLRTVILAHLSEVNNTPEKALASGREGLGLYYSDVKLVIASVLTKPTPLGQRIEL